MMDPTKDTATASKLEHQEINCPQIGNVNVYIQGARSSKEVVIMTVHDLGCDLIVMNRSTSTLLKCGKPVSDCDPGDIIMKTSTLEHPGYSLEMNIYFLDSMYQVFVDHQRMTRIRERTVWIHIDVPGQGQNMPDLPPDYQFPTMQKIAENLVHVLDQLQIKEVVCFGEGAGANIMARFAMSHIDRVLGIVLLHATGTTAGFLGSLKDKVINWKLDHIGMNPSAEAYLVLHRYGAFSRAKDTEQLKAAIENYQEMLRTKANAKNLKKFVEAFLRRTNIADSIKKLKCPVLLVTGQKSVFNGTTRALHQAILKTCSDKAKIEFIEIAGVANVLEEKPDKLAESFQYFLQGLGLVSSLPMHNMSRTVPPPLRVRSMSMVEYDMPACQRLSSGGTSGPSTPILASPTSPVEAEPIAQATSG